MSFNVILAFVPVVFGRLMFSSKNIYLKILFGFVWFFFLPNTIYLLTDIIHFSEDAQKITGLYLAADLVLYILLFIIGIFTFILAIDPFEKTIFGNKKRSKFNLAFIYAINFLVGFGLVLGRVHRINSWEVVTNTGKVVKYSLETVSSWELMIFVILFALMCHVVYVFSSKVITKKLYFK